jgi:DNA-binding XRE family transcriptional regulator
LSVSTTTIQNWETGKTQPKLKHLRAISELSGVPMDCIFLPVNP